MLTCYIVDDEISSIEILSDYIKENNGLRLLGATTRPQDALDVMAQPVRPDITFLDIDMPGINGMELAEIIKDHTSIVFITAHPEYGAPAFEKDAFDFLVKPISRARFLKSVMKVRTRSANLPSQNDNDYIYIQDNRNHYTRINCSDLVYIQGYDNHVHIYTTGGRHISYLTLKELEYKLNPAIFIRTHKSYIINLQKLATLDGNQLIMEDKTKLPLGQTYRERLLNLLNSKLIVTDRKRDKDAI